MRAKERASDPVLASSLLVILNPCVRESKLGESMERERLKGSLGEDTTEPPQKQKHDAETKKETGKGETPENY